VDKYRTLICSTYGIRQTALIRLKKQKDAITLASVDYDVDTRIGEINKCIIYADSIKIPFLRQIRDTKHRDDTDRLKSARVSFTGRTFFLCLAQANGTRAY